MPRQPQRQFASIEGQQLALPSEINIPPGYDIGNVRAICWGIETGLGGLDLLPFLENLTATFQELEVVMEIYRNYDHIVKEDRWTEIKVAFSKYSEKSNVTPKKKPCYTCGKNFIYWNLVTQKVLLDGATNLKSVELCSDCYRKKSKYVLRCGKHFMQIYLGKKKGLCPLYPTKCKVNSCPSPQCLNEHAEKVHKGYHLRRWKATKRHYSSTEGGVIKSNILTGVEFEVVGKNKECLRTNLYKLGKKIGLDHDHSIEAFYLNTEVITPPASGRKLEALIKETGDALSKDGFIVNDRCGLHIHIDLFNRFGHININPDFYKTLLAEYVMWESVFYRLVPISRSQNANIKPIADKYIRYFNSPSQVSQLKFSKIVYRTNDDSEVMRQRSQKRPGGMLGPKYYWANFHSLLRKEGLEIRLMEGTTDANAVLWWTKFNHDFIIRASKDPQAYMQFPERYNKLMNNSEEKIFELFLQWLEPIYKSPESFNEMVTFLRKRLAMHRASTSSGVSSINDRDIIQILQNMPQLTWNNPL